MSKPQSLKIDPWYAFPKQQYSFLTDDFVHEKLFVAKVNAKSEKSTANLKATLTQKDKKMTVSDELKLWFNLSNGNSIIAKSASDHTKIKYDHGITQWNNKKWNFYGALRSSKHLDNLSLRLGAHHLSSKCDSDNRIRIDFTSDNKKNIFWYNRTVLNHENFGFGILGIYGITSQVFVKNDLLFSYKPTQVENTSIFLRLENKQFRKTNFKMSEFNQYFKTATVNVISKYKSVKYGIEGVFNIQDKKASVFTQAKAVVEHYEQNYKLTSKLRVSSDLSASLSLKFPGLLFKDIATTTVGVHANNLASLSDGFKYGAQIQFNV